MSLVAPDSKPPAAIDVRTRLAFSPEEAAAVLGISRNMIYKLKRQGKIKFVKAGSRSLISRDQLDALLAGDAAA